VSDHSPTAALTEPNLSLANLKRSRAERRLKGEMERQSREQFERARCRHIEETGA